MFNRRHLRIKILHAIYAYFVSDSEDIKKAENELFHSVDKMYELYLQLNLLLLEVRNVARDQIDLRRGKKLPSKDDLSPNMKFAGSLFLSKLEYNLFFKRKLEESKVSWANDKELVRTLFKEVEESDVYRDYMNSGTRGFEEDKMFAIKIFKFVLINSEALQEHLEESSIFWNDDLDIVASMTIKSLKLIKEDTEIDLPLLELYKEEEEEREFISKIFRKSILNSEDLDVIINKHTENWDLERIASMDIMLMKMAVTEASEFAYIPTKVSLNEYIEIAKYYSTPKSNGFINGVLDKVFAELIESGEIKKTGKGLIN